MVDNGACGVISRVGAVDVLVIIVNETFKYTAAYRSSAEIITETWIVVQRHSALLKDVVEGRPAASRVVLGVRVEQLLFAHYAHVRSFLVEFVEFS